MDFTDFNNSLSETFSPPLVKKSKLKSLFDLLVTKLTLFVTTAQASETAAAASAAQAAALNTSFIARSLNLSASIYVDGVNGDDTRTGATNDNNSVTGRVKTLARVATLHNNKTFSLSIYVVGNLDISANVFINSPYVLLQPWGGATITFKKRIGVTDGAGNLVGEGNYMIIYQGQELNILISGVITVEGHSGSTGLGDQWSYRNVQGAISLNSPNMMDSSRPVVVNVLGAGVLNIGDNALLFSASIGTNGDYLNSLARYRRSGIWALTVNLGVNAKETYQFGDKLFPRSYHPTGANDSNVFSNELVESPNTYQLFLNRGGIVRLAHYLRRYHPTSNTDAAVWEGEIVVSTTNNDLYYKTNGTIRRITTAVYS